MHDRLLHWSLVTAQAVWQRALSYWNTLASQMSMKRDSFSSRTSMYLAAFTWEFSGSSLGERPELLFADSWNSSTPWLKVSVLGVARTGGWLDPCQSCSHCWKAFFPLFNTPMLMILTKIKYLSKHGFCEERLLDRLLCYVLKGINQSSSDGLRRDSFKCLMTFSVDSSSCDRRILDGSSMDHDIFTSCYLMWATRLRERIGLACVIFL